MELKRTIIVADDNQQFVVANIIHGLLKEKFVKIEDNPDGVTLEFGGSKVFFPTSYDNCRDIMSITSGVTDLFVDRFFNIPRQPDIRYEKIIGFHRSGQPIEDGMKLVREGAQKYPGLRVFCMNDDPEHMRNVVAGFGIIPPDRIYAPGKRPSLVYRQIAAMFKGCYLEVVKATKRDRIVSSFAL